MDQETRRLAQQLLEKLQASLAEPKEMSVDKLATVVAYTIKEAGGKLVIPLTTLNEYMEQDFNIEGESDAENVTLTVKFIE